MTKQVQDMTLNEKQMMFFEKVWDIQLLFLILKQTAQNLLK